MKKKLVAVLAGLCLILAAVLVGCGGNGGNASNDTGDTGADVAAVDTEKTEIVIGGVRSQSGPLAIFDQTAFGPIYRMWADEINADGGLYVEEYGKKLPIRLVIYDDKSDVQTMTRLYEQLCLEEKVDLLLPPVSTAALFAAAPIAQKYGYLLMSAEGGATSLKEYIAQCPNFFSVLSFSETQVPALVEYCKENNIGSAYIVYIEDLHGTEYYTATENAFEAAGIEIKVAKSIPLDPTSIDFNAIINEAKSSGAQLFCSYTYPDQGIPLAATAIALDYNPDIYLMGSGSSFDFIKDSLAGDSGIDPNKMVEGLTGWGAWNEKSSPGAKEFSQHFVETFGPEGDNSLGTTIYQDWWGHLCYLTVVDVIQQAIENTGTLDNAKLVEYIKNNRFNSAMGEIWFEDNMLAGECYLGNIGQWQNGIFEVVDVGERRTADPIIPKPAWPKS
ncbi:MAG: amino acid ABC transporter substrate-binding protein [Clostridiales Family XIII bacterium]|jgi:branched-chain amino acid transport system substrate-binding protein|nr:amino acid ABC transporter substrate-binding protein [Clostridiales Family XIII bacterium]